MLNYVLQTDRFSRIRLREYYKANETGRIGLVRVGSGRVKSGQIVSSCSINSKEQNVFNSGKPYPKHYALNYFSCTTCLQIFIAYL